MPSTLSPRQRWSADRIHVVPDGSSLHLDGDRRSAGARVPLAGTGSRGLFLAAREAEKSSLYSRCLSD